MDYNEYDSNGNKKKSSIVDLFLDKQKRSLLIVVIYIVLIFFLVIFVRNSISKDYKDNSNDNSNVIEVNEKVDENDNEKEVEEKVYDNLDEMFSFIDNNNYNFSFILDYNNDQFITEGIRYNNKYNFTYKNKDQILYFLGTVGNLKMKNNDRYTNIVFPYTYFNYFDNNLIKKVIRESNYVDGKYEISTSKFNELLNYESSSKNGLNTIELFTRNNKVVEIKIDFTDALSSITLNESLAVIDLKYSNFGLIDDFNVDFD